MKNTSLTYYIEQYIDGKITVDEWKVLQQMMAQPENEQLLHQLMEEQLRESSMLNDEFPNTTKSIITAVKKKMQASTSSTSVHPISRKHIYRRWSWAAAVFILAIGLGVYYFNNQSYKSHKSSQTTVQTKGTGSDIAPGINKAIWILTDGKQIELDSTVLDMTSKREPSNNIGYNELRTPRGGQYQLILPDGSKVWLNAASSIKYPVVFDKKERRVEINGEAYFEITKDAKKPFIVSGGDQQIEVLGTTFNVNVYDNESIKKTTLLTGSVKVNNQQLQPGQAYINGKIVQTNLEQDIAWKNGLFNFNGLSLLAVMKQLERWYDVEVVYQKSIPSIELEGKMTRDISLKGLLRILENVGLKTKLEDRRLTILP